MCLSQSHRPERHERSGEALSFALTTKAILSFFFFSFGMDGKLSVDSTTLHLVSELVHYCDTERG